MVSQPAEDGRLALLDVSVLCQAPERWASSFLRGREGDVSRFPVLRDHPMPIFFDPVVSLTCMAADLFVVSMTDSADLYGAAAATEVGSFSKVDRTRARANGPPTAPCKCRVSHRTFSSCRTRTFVRASTKEGEEALNGG